MAPLRLRRGQGAMQRNPCYARLFADLPYTPPNPIKASGGRSRAPPVARGARRKPSEQGSARKASRADAARLLRTALRPPNPQGFFDRLKRAGPGAKGPGPRSFRALRALPPPPLRQSFLQRQKGKGKARPHDLWGLAHETLSGRGTATAPPLGQSPGPRYPGPGGFIRTAAGYNPLTTSPACARRSPWAQHRGD